MIMCTLFLTDYLVTNESYQTYTSYFPLSTEKVQHVHQDPFPSSCTAPVWHTASPILPWSTGYLDHTFCVDRMGHFALCVAFVQFWCETLLSIPSFAIVASLKIFQGLLSFWGKNTAMGRQIILESSLFTKWQVLERINKTWQAKKTQNSPWQDQLQLLESHRDKVPLREPCPL